MRTASREPSLHPQRDITGPPRLALLYLWHRDDRAPTLVGSEVAFYGVRGRALTSPRMVDWSDFPWGNAFTAVLAMK